MFRGGSPKVGEAVLKRLPMLAWMVALKPIPVPAAVSGTHPVDWAGKPP